jgi:hypothetical protein
MAHWQLEANHNQNMHPLLEEALHHQKCLGTSKSDQHPHLVNKKTRKRGSDLNHMQHDMLAPYNPCQPTLQAVSLVINTRPRTDELECTTSRQRRVIHGKPPSSIDRLSTEILTAIFVQIRNLGEIHYLGSCLRVSKHWYSIILPVLYRDVTLTNDKIIPFCQKHDESYYGYVRSLSISIRPISLKKPSQIDEATRVMMAQGRKNELESSVAKTLWFYVICYITARIHKMRMLATFSLTLSNKVHVPHFFIPTEAITMLVDSLPPACINLEIDTMGEELWGRSTQAPPHICSSIAHILPRLKNLRLRLGQICPSALGFISLDSVPKAAPKLETCLINLIKSKLDCSQLCGQTTNEPNLARIAMTSCFKQLIDKKKCPQIKTAIVFDLDLGSDDPFAFHSRPIAKPSSKATFFRRNIIEGTTWAIPFNQIRGKDGKFWTFRSPEGEELLSYMWAIQDYQEGGTWKLTTAGTRCPTSLLADEMECSDISGHQEKIIPMYEVEIHRKKIPARTTQLWINEDVCGQRLRSAVLREGILDVQPVEEDTPPGWSRMGAIIFPER